jgi:hypothetical protein
MTEVAEKPQDKRALILNPQRMSLAEQVRQDWVVNAEQGTTVADVLDPQYWAHMASQLQAWDRVDVRLETGEWLLELLVINTGRNWAQVHLLKRHDLEQRSETMPAAQKHKIEWKGPQHKWCVIRLSDSEMIQRELASKDAAGQWLTTYEHTTG